LKYYKGGKYAFLALLPNEGMSIESYIDSLDGENLYSLLSNVIRCEVRTSIPKFESEFAIEFSEILSNMGMPTPFDPYNANFTKMGESITKQLYISRVIHKTFIQVAEKGTKAGAVTVVEVGDNASAAPTEPKRVYLNRPFVYMIIDTQNNVPIFIGSMTDIS
jgi:serpin B